MGLDAVPEAIKGRTNPPRLPFKLIESLVRRRFPISLRLRYKLLDNIWRYSATLPLSPMAPSTRNQTLLIAAYLLIGAAVLTLIPSDVKIASDLGYHSLCPFAPWSALLLLLAAGILAAFRSYLMSRTD